eukprot:scaffold201055_cov29-Tisochrysis_lutea.AAC.10
MRPSIPARAPQNGASATKRTRAPSGPPVRAMIDEVYSSYSASDILLRGRSDVAQSSTTGSN